MKTQNRRIIVAKPKARTESQFIGRLWESTNQKQTGPNICGLTSRVQKGRWTAHKKKAPVFYILPFEFEF